ncbi:MAG TPA: hypothetical protein VK889_09765 [Solirubrobacterales bacterium]|nr:hypothetical protein [Solirubrobacterales bacterium]
MSKRLHSEIVERLESLPEEILALESAMEEFGEGFELNEFKRAFERKDGIKAYNRVQAVERAFNRVQNDVVELAERGTRLAQLELPNLHEANSARAFDALKEAGVIDATLCRNLKRAQRARSDVEHDYPGMKAGRLHSAIELGLPSARAFIRPYGAWIAPYLE